jgi:hypothetical protein
VGSALLPLPVGVRCDECCSGICGTAAQVMLRDRGGNAQLAWYQVLGLLTQLCLTQALSCRQADQP